MTPYEIDTPKMAQGTALKIAFLSDIHADTRFMPAKRLRRVVETANGLGADLIVLGGDYSTQNNWRMTPLDLTDTLQILAGLQAPLGVVAILGNHDWWDDPATQTGDSVDPETVRIMQDVGIRVMRNEAMVLDHSTGVGLAALDSQMAFERKIKPHEGADDLAKTIKPLSSDRFNILLAHEPDIFADLKDIEPRVPVDLVLSGHTHGGQIRLFGARPVVPSAYGPRFAYGHMHEDGRDLLVSGGLGCSSIPVRLGVMPEILCVTINGSKPDDPATM